MQTTTTAAPITRSRVGERPAGTHPCEVTYADGGSLVGTRCDLPAGHAGEHESRPRDTYFGYRWVVASGKTTLVALTTN